MQPETPCPVRGQPADRAALPALFGIRSFWGGPALAVLVDVLVFISFDYLLAP